MRSFHANEVTIQWVSSLISKLRKRARLIVNKAFRNDRERGVLMALLIGDKSELDDGVRASYSNAGAMHVLAVSGLHVGILYVILLKVLNTITFFKRRSWAGQMITIAAYPYRGSGSSMPPPW
jgi:competence protein ComEC